MTPISFREHFSFYIYPSSLYICVPRSALICIFRLVFVVFFSPFSWYQHTNNTIKFCPSEEKQSISVCLLHGRWQLWLVVIDTPQYVCLCIWFIFTTQIVTYWLGVVFKKYPKPKSVRKSISTIKLPKHEDLCSTKQVLPVHLSQFIMPAWQNIFHYIVYS